MSFGFEPYILGCLAVFGIVVWLTWRRRTVTAGLPLSYLLSLSLIHLFGALLYLLPWQDTLLAGFVFLGFKQYFYGNLAFLAGMLVIEVAQHKRRGTRSSPVMAGSRAGVFPTPASPYRSFTRTADQRPVEEPIRRLEQKARTLPAIYLGMGVLFVGIFIPILRSIPSIGAVATCGAYLMIVGFCLACWRLWHEDEIWKLFGWMALTAAFPVFTTLALGFIGYGTVAMMIILVFVATIYRPRWHAVLCAVLISFIGLSAFVTYMRDRDEYRLAMEAGEGLSQRYDRLVDMFSNFEFFDIKNEYHLYYVDQRLNQNWMVGMAVANLDVGNVPFAHGRTLYEALQAMVPRIIWPDKPVRAGSPEIVSRYTGLVLNEDSSFGVGQVMEFYINYGTWGVLVGFFSFGLLVRWVDFKAALSLRRGNAQGFVAWFLPGLSLLQTGGSLVEVTSSALASIVLVLGVNKVLIPLLVFEQKPKSAKRGARARKQPEINGPSQMKKLNGDREQPGADSIPG